MKKYSIFITILLFSLLLQWDYAVTTIHAEANIKLNQEYADNLKGKLLKEVIAELGEADSVEEIEEMKSATWTDADGNYLVVTTGIDGKRIEVVMFSEAGSLDVEFIEADLAEVYDNLRYLSSYEEVVKEIGAAGTRGAHSKADFGDFTATSTQYTWMTDDVMILSLSFTNDGLEAKWLFANGEVKSDYYQENQSEEDNKNSNQEKSSTAEETDFTIVTADLKSLYKTLQYGISYQEAVAEIGAKGTKWDSEQAGSGNSKLSSVVYAWQTNEAEVLSLAFIDDKLEAKALIVDGKIQSTFNDEDTGDDEIVIKENEPSNDEKIDEEENSGNQNENFTSNHEEKLTATVVKDETEHDEQNHEHTLPNTATTIFTWLLIGAIILLIGGLGVFLTRKKK